MMFAPGDTLGGCKILGTCGSGAYGKVFLAENALGQRVAIKLFFGANDEEKTLDSLRQYIALPPSPHLLRIFHFGHENGQLFYVMEAADNAGEEGKYLPDTLALRVKRNGHLSAQEAIATCQAMAEALGTLHKAHLVHRDIKHDNVLFVNGIPKLSDPDLLCNFTKTISLAGTRGYIPPEAYNTNLKNSPTTDI
ncbi:MAG: protein kinase, partial [Victivallales bacterium]|nr:protein kinase [Victivallales bacterium]